MSTMLASRCLSRGAFLNLYCKELFISRRSKILASFESRHFKNKRFYLSTAYKCEDKWNSRFKDEYLKDIRPVEYYYSLIKKYKNEGKLSAIDADIFVNSLSGNHSLELVDEMEEVLHLLRKSPETIHTLPSTAHAIIRALLEVKKYDLILRIISDPMNYGVFVDFYIANLLMNTFIEEKNYMAAARVASTLMLQEDFGPPMTRTLVLLSCFEYIFNEEENDVWVDFNPVVEPEEEVKVVVGYIRNPYFDDHFDLKNPIHILGKTLAWLSFHIEDPSLQRHSRLLGWSLYEKWDKLSDSLAKIVQEKLAVPKDVFTKVAQQVEACQDEAIKSKLSGLVLSVSEANLVMEEPLMPAVRDNAAKCAQTFQAEMISNQYNIYDSWIAIRKEAVERQMEMYERNRLLAEIEAKKADLKRREDIIFFFDNKDKYEVLLAKKQEEELRQKASAPKLKKKITDDSEYVPPTV